MVLPFQRRMLGARIVIPGSTSYPSAGTYSFVVPDYNTLTVTLDGPGGGGGGTGTGNVGGTGTASSIAALSLQANSGTGGAIAPSSFQHGANGSPGTASGGDTNITGGGSLGGTGTYWNAGPNGGYAGDGGRGGRAAKVYTLGAPGAPVPGTVITIVVGTGGVKGANASPYIITPNTDGQPGSAAFSWT